MPKSNKFCLSWHASSSVQVELFNPRPEGDNNYQLKYTPPFRTTIRPPILDISVGPKEIEKLGQMFNKLMEVSVPRGEAGATAPAQPINSNLVSLGKLLFTILPPFLRPDISAPGLFFEIGLEEPLLAYPWELMHDGEQFLCLKHFMGRFVNSSEKIPSANRPPESYKFNTPLDKISILLIAVPKPQTRDDGTQYDQLSQAEAEMDAIISTLAGEPDIDLKVRTGKEANFSNITKDLSEGGYHIVHFCGHAKFDEKRPRQSSLVLHDDDLTTGWLYTSIVGKPPVPVFCFINGCETARSNVDAKDAQGRNIQMNVFSLARALLDTGTYLLGTRWKVDDTAAKHFASQFYTSLLKEGKPLGHAIQEARRECQKAVAEDDLAWASYILYGDPRVLIRRT